MSRKTQKERYEIIIYGLKYGATSVCKRYQISRTIYYRWLNRFKAKGIDGLADVKRHHIPKNKATKELEKEVLEQIKIYPEYGPLSIAWILEDEGIKISESGVFNIMQRHELTTKKKRLLFANLYPKKTFKSKKVEELPLPEYAGIGKVWLCWTVNLGNISEIGHLYQYMILDVKSGFGCARIYKNKNTDCALDILQAIAIPMAEALNIYPKFIVTCNAQEYTSGRTLGNHRYSVTLRNLGIKHVLWSDEYTEYTTLAHEFSTKLQKYLKQKIFIDKLDFLKLKTFLQQYLIKYNFKKPFIHDKTPYEIIDSQGANKTAIPLWVYINPLHTVDSNKK